MNGSNNLSSHGKEDEMAATKAAALEAYEKMLEAQQHFRKAAEAAGMDMKQEAMEQVRRGKEKAEELGAEAVDYVREKPLASLGIAVLVGYVLAHILGRR